MVDPPDDDLLRARSLHFRHDDGHWALRGVSVGLRRHEIVAVVGPRGSGKTTLLGCLAGLLRPGRGEIRFDGALPRTRGRLSRARLRGRHLAWIDSGTELTPGLDVRENTALPLMLRGAARRQAETVALEWLERMDVGASAHRHPWELRHAERSRVRVARALATAPTVLFADDPTRPPHGAGAHERADAVVVARSLTTAARGHGITVVLATDDPRVAALADRTVALLDGRRVRTVHLPPLAGTNAASPAAGTEGRAACSLSA
ncbi:ATP-binding cassette domain-containing protein [Streptomyces sp. ZYX-F-203]